MFSSSHAAELKTQAITDAARDPNSNVTSDDAQKVMADESKKAGVPAYRFDPDASPEEKAAAIHAGVPSSIVPHRSHGTGVITDIDDGAPDDYDLPPPSKEGAITSPTSATFDSKTNGHIHAVEKASYEERVGWAPRFGLNTMTEAEANESVLDHATYLETKLEDKFFGDWYHNAAVIVFACLSSWVVALLGGGLGWVFIIMAACGTYYRTSIRRVRRNFRDDLVREMAKTRMETDTESLEWINGFLLKFWPIYAPVLCETIINSVDQVLSTSTPAVLDSMRMKFFTLGTKPPRLDYVKTYPKAEDDIILMDWKFSFTPGDRNDLTARQLKDKVNPKVVLEVRVGKGVISKGLDVIVEDFAFSGLMRVKFKLQLPFPHIEKVEICFLDRPDIDYVCKPLGGETLGFDINFVPGLEGFIKEQIHANLAPIMYDPNVFPIEIAKMLSGSAVDQAIGVLAVTIHGAQGLRNPDKLAGAPDPYTVVSFNNGPSLGKTKILKQNASPHWNETIYIIVTSLTDTLSMEVFDYNEYRKDKGLGLASFAMDQLQEVPEQENMQLEIKANNKPRGILQSDVRFFPVLEALKLEDGSEQPAPETNTGIAKFTVEQAQDLDGSKSLIGALSPYAVLLLNGKEIHTTQKLKRTNKPIWPNGSKEFLVTDRKAARLGVVVKDEREFGGDVVIGSYQIKVDDMMKMMEQGKEWYQLAGAKTGRVKLMLQWKPIALRGASGATGGYVTPIGVMRLHFKNARNLRNVETMGKSDPYVRVLLSGIPKGKTVTFQNELNPTWDEVIYVPMHSARERLTLEVMDYQSIGKDRSLGLIDLPAADYIQEREGEYLVHSERKEQSEGLKMQGRGQAKGVLNFTASFYPTIPTIDPEEEEAEKKEMEEALKSGVPGRTSTLHSRTGSKSSMRTAGSRRSLDKKDPVASANQKENEAGKIDTSLARQLDKAELDSEDQPVKDIPKIRLTGEDLTKYESGLLIFKLISGEFSRSNVYLEVLMDDMVFPSYSSSKTSSRTTEFGEIGDAMVRELDLSKITLRLVEKQDKKGEGDSKEDRVAGKLQGATIDVVKRCLYTPTELTLKASDGSVSKVTVLMKYLPIKMQLDPSESMNNMGTLRVDVLDAAELPSADRNGFSDPYAKFEMNGESVYKTKVQKKTLHPAWNEFFETPITSRTAAKFTVRVMDWDFGDKADFLGDCEINLEILEPMQAKEVTLTLNGKAGPGTAGVIRLRLLFKSSYVTRSRQGSSTFSGTIGPAGKVIGAPVKGVGLIGGAVGGGVMKGASFMRHGFKGSKDSTKRVVSNDFSGAATNGNEASNGHANGSALAANGDTPIPSIEEPLTPQKSLPPGADGQSPAPFLPSPHGRSPSFGAKSVSSAAGATGSGSGSKPETGTAEFSVVSASGFPTGAKVQVYLSQLTGGKSHRDVLKTKPIKATGDEVRWDESDKSTRYACAPDAQFQVQVKDHSMFGGDVLGEALFFIDDSAVGSEKTVTVGPGQVVLRTRFEMASQADAGSLKDRSMRRSLLSKRGELSRQATPS